MAYSGAYDPRPAARKAARASVKARRKRAERKKKEAAGLTGRGGAGRGQGRKPGIKNIATTARELEVLYKIQNKLMAVEGLDQGMHVALQLAQHYRPLDEEGKLRKQYDKDEFRWAMRMLATFAGDLAQYQSPRVSPIMPPPPKLENDGVPRRIRMDVFSAKGERIMTLENGVEVENDEPVEAGQ